MSVEPISAGGIAHVLNMLDLRAKRIREVHSTALIDQDLVAQVPHMLARIEQLEEQVKNLDAVKIAQLK